MVETTTTYKRPFWPSIPGKIMLASLAVLIVASCTGCSVINGWLSGKQGYNSNDATMENWGNPSWGLNPYQESQQ